LKTEEAPYEGAHSHIQTLHPHYHVKDGLIEPSSQSAVTSSTLSILPPDNVHRTHPAEKPKDYRLGWLSWHTTNNKNLKLTGVRGLNFLVLSVWDKRDRKMIINLDQLTQGLNIAKPNARRLIDLLIAENLIVRLVQGSCKKGQGRICSQYGLGSGFDGEPPRMWGKDKLLSNTNEGRGVQRLPFGQEVTGSVNLNGQAVRGLPSPNSTLNTHTKELPLAFTKENWLNRGKANYPDWDADNMTSAFYGGEMKGLNGNWPSFQDKCYHLRRVSAKTTPAPAPKGWQRQPIKPQESSCFSPRLMPLDYTDPIILRDEIYFALRDRNGISGIVGSAKGQGVASDLVDVAVAHADTRLKDYYASKNNKLCTFDSLKFEGGGKIKI